MASRADVAPPPTIRGAVRAALGDAYYHSWRLVPANALWSVVALGLAVAIAITSAGLILAPLLALPTAGIFRLTARIARGEAASFGDALDAWRADVRRTLAVGGLMTVAVVVLGANVVIGLSSGSPLGWGLATLAGWGLVALVLLAWTIWPVLEDPRRAHQPVRDRLRLAALLTLAHPFRIAGLAVALAAFLLASAVAIVAIVTVSVSLGALVACRFVLPAADRLEADLAARAGATPATSPGEPTTVSSTR